MMILSFIYFVFHGDNINDYDIEKGCNCMLSLYYFIGLLTVPIARFIQAI